MEMEVHASTGGMGWVRGEERGGATERVRRGGFEEVIDRWNGLLSKKFVYAAPQNGLRSAVTSASG